MGRWLHGLAALAVVGACGCALPSGPAGAGDGGGAFDLAGLPGDAGDMAQATDLSSTGDACVPGASCMTGQAGACGPGRIVCAGGGVARCEPEQAAQACYTGPAATNGVGACKSGMQACMVGSSCAGEVVPAAKENCLNDLDDDCNGVVNDGCPSGIAIGAPRPLTARGDTVGGSPFTLRCPAGAYLTKLVQYGDNIDQTLAGIDIFCASPVLSRTASSFVIAPTAVTPSPATVRGTNVNTSASTTTTWDCGAGFSPGWWTVGAYLTSQGVVALGMFCQSSALTLGANNQLSFGFTKTGSGAAIGYSYTNAQKLEDDCAANEVLVGYDGRVGSYLNSLQAVCAPISVTYTGSK